jgi:hypothetical protein
MPNQTQPNNEAGAVDQERLVRLRYSVASDGSENTVYDHEDDRDLFPTKSGNRDYQCRKCDAQTAEEIALAMNVYDLTMRENHLYEIGSERLARRCRQEIFRLCGFETNA